VFGGLAVWLGCLSHQRTLAAADTATRATYEATIADLRSRAARIDTVWRVRDSIVTKRVVNWDSVSAWANVWARALSKTDSVPVEVVREVIRTVTASGDSTVAACTALQSTCAEQRAALTAIVAADSSVIRALSRSLARAKWRSRVACTAGPGAAVVGSAVRVSYGAVVCGLRVF
jgi:hypothetical protein